MHLLDHAVPVQIYPVQIFDEMSAKHNGDRTPFEDQNMIVTLLHDPRIEEEPAPEPTEEDEEDGEEEGEDEEDEPQTPADPKAPAPVKRRRTRKSK